MRAGWKEVPGWEKVQEKCYVHDSTGCFVIKGVAYWELYGRQKCFMGVLAGWLSCLDYALSMAEKRMREAAIRRM